MTRRKNEGTLFTCPAENTPRQAGEPHNVIAVLRPLDVRGALHQRHGECFASMNEGRRRGRWVFPFEQRILTAATAGPLHRLYRLDMRHAVLDRTAHDLRLFLQPSDVLPRGRMCCFVVCLCTREQRRSGPIPFLGFVPSRVAICCSLWHPKGKKRTTSWTRW